MVRTMTPHRIRTAPLRDASLHLRLPSDELTTWRDVARLERISVTDLVRRALAAHVAGRHGMLRGDYPTILAGGSPDAA